MNAPGELLVTSLPDDTRCVTRWTEAAALAEAFSPSGQWIFRGSNNSSYGLQTSLERVVLGLSAHTKKPTKSEQRVFLTGTFGSAKRTIFDIEGGLMRAFRRRCHHYLDRPPKTPVELLALMQHHEAPTRLLDWTYSFYVALFFAVDRAEAQKSEQCVIWAVDTSWLVAELRSRYPHPHGVLDLDRNLQKDLSTFKNVFRQERRFVCPVNPYYLNERLSIQQGVFLCPGAVRCPFEDNLAEFQYRKDGDVYSPLAETKSKLAKIKVSTSPSTRIEILQQLHRMNMSRASLFPGIDGFARSLENILAFPDILEYGEKYETDFPI